MDAADFTRGLRVNGSVYDTRRAVDARFAFARHCAAHPDSQPHREAYLSVFRFDQRMDDLLGANGSERGYAGPAWAEWHWSDVDRADLAQALADARRLAACALDRFKALDPEQMLLFLSGNKGFHLGLPCSLWNPQPGKEFPAVCKEFALSLASRAGVVIDESVYNVVRIFRAPNSRHPKSELHKRRLSYDELMNLSLDRIRRLAAQPLPFDLPESPFADSQAQEDWALALRTVAEESKAKGDARQAVAEGVGRLNRLTTDAIREGISGDPRRAVRLFSAAANLAEFGCPELLAQELLFAVGTESGLPPSEVRREIRCGWEHGRPKG